MARHPDRTALISSDGRQSYRELATDVRRLANALLRLGVARGDKVGLWLPNYPEWIVSNLAVAAVGAVTVPLNARFRAREAAHVLRVGEVSVLVTTDAFLSNRYLEIVEELRPGLPGLRHVITVRASRPWALEYRQLIEQEPPELSPALRERLAAGRVEEPVDMFWTSGSTGPPKGALIPHTVLENVWNYNHIYRYSEQDRCIVPTPLSYGTGHYWGMLASLLAGAAMVLLREFTPHEVLAAAEREQATTLVGSPTTFARYVDEFQAVSARPEHLRLAWAGGAYFPLELARNLKRLLRVQVVGQVYGMTELAGIATMTRLEDSLEDATRSVGFALPGFELRLVEPQGGGDAGHGPGELWVRSHMSALGYHGMSPEELATYFTEDGWYRTGDILERDAAGRFYFRTRLKDVIKVGGENVTASEIEQVLLEHPAIRLVAVFGVPDPRRSEVPVAVLEAVEPVGQEQLREWCRERMAPFKVPARFLLREALPLTVTGKIARADLKSEVLEELA